MWEDKDEFIPLGALGVYWDLSDGSLRRHKRDGALLTVKHRGRVMVAVDEIRRCEDETVPADAEGRPLPLDAGRRRETLLRVEAAAKVARYDPDTLYDLAAKGLAPSVKVFGARRFREAALRTWIAQGPRASVAPLPKPDPRLNGKTGE